MADLRSEYQAFLKQRKSKLHERLKDELPPAYKDTATGNANAGVLEGSFKRIAPNEDPYDLVKTWHNYEPSWNHGKSMATALRMLLTEQIGLPRYAVISGYTKKTLAKILVGIDAADAGVPRQPDIHAPLTLPPDISLPVPDPPDLPETRPSHVNNRIPLSDLAVILDHYGNPSDQTAVYVLDCTPEPAVERRALRELRRHTWAKWNANKPLDGDEIYAQALNEGERLYYVGLTNDLEDRMHRHRRGAATGGAYFTNFFTPKGVVDVSWYDTEGEAREAEKNTALEYTTPGESRGFQN